MSFQLIGYGEIDYINTLEQNIKDNFKIKFNDTLNYIKIYEHICLERFPYNIEEFKIYVDKYIKKLNIPPEKNNLIKKYLVISQACIEWKLENMI